MKTGLIVVISLAVVIFVLLGVIFFYPPTTKAPVVVPVTPPIATSTVSTSTAPASTPLTVTQADNGSTIHLMQGERFTLAFGTGLTWHFMFEPDGIITGSATAAGGNFEAAASGTATLRASGAPICDPGKACPQFIVETVITFVVQ